MGNLCGTTFWLTSESQHLRDLLAHTDTLTVLEASINVPTEEMTLHASCKKKVAFSDGTEWHLVVCIEVSDKTQIELREDVQRLVWTTHS